MLDRDLAGLYEVTTGNLNKAAKRNIERFPDDFMFQLSEEEAESLRFQIGSLKRGEHFKYLPFAFTENGVAMLSVILNSPRAIQVNIQIMRAFVKKRKPITGRHEYAQGGTRAQWVKPLRKCGRELPGTNHIKIVLLYLTRIVYL